MAKKCKKCGETKPISEYSSSKFTRDRLDPRCKTCVSAISRESYLKNKEKVLAKQAERRRNDPEYRKRCSQYAREWVVRNPKRAMEYKKIYQEANRELINKRSRDWQLANREKELERLRIRSVTHKDSIRESKKRRYLEKRDDYLRRGAEWYQENRDRVQQRHREWFKANPGWSRKNTAIRKATMLRAMPPWADMEKMAAIYAEATRISSETGVPHHVDHIVPLRSKIVCGLHWEGNLQIIPASENLRKGNRLMECVNG